MADLDIEPEAPDETARSKQRDLAALTVAALLVFLTLILVDAISIGAAVLGFAVIAGIAVWRFRINASAGTTKHSSVGPEEDDSQYPAISRDVAIAAMEQLPDPMMLLDRLGRVVLFNQAATLLLGTPPTDRHVSSVIRNPSVLEGVSMVLDGAPAQIVEYSNLVPVERHLRAHVAPVSTGAISSTASPEGPRQLNVVVVLHDLTAVKRSEQMRVDFVANASHELRTPLSSLTGFIETLRGHAKDDDKARERFLGIMQNQGERMGRLIDDLLSLSRIEMNEHVAPGDEVDLIAIVRDVFDAAQPRAAERNVTLRLTVQGKPADGLNNGALSAVLGDRDELVQVVQNLVTNAIKYGTDGSTVTIDLGEAAPPRSADTSPVNIDERDHGTPAPTSAAVNYLAVSDQGSGISREHLPRLTERFYRVDVKRSREEGGTGLGLAIVKHIVNRHRGWLTIESKVSKGSTFTVFLPRIEQAEDQPETFQTPANGDDSETPPDQPNLRLVGS